MADPAFDLIADPTRRRILDLLRQGEQPVGAIVQRLETSQPNVSRHLRLLRDGGLVDVRIDAQRRLYRLRPAPLAEIDRWLAPYRVFWANALDRLEQHLETTSEERHE